jgi:DUF1680 family protein
VLVNGQEAARSGNPGSYIDVARNWRNGDRVELRLQMEVAAESAVAAPDVVAFTYGPLVLAGAFGREGLVPGSDIIINEREYGKYNDAPFTPPSLAGDPASIAAAVRPSGKPLEFTIQSAEQAPVRLIPYHRIAHERYATYWEVQPARV